MSRRITRAVSRLATELHRRAHVVWTGNAAWSWLEGDMPIILWLLGVPVVVILLLMLTHVI